MRRTEAFAGAAKERAVARVLRAIGRCASMGSLDAREVAALPPLATPLPELLRALHQALAADLAGVHDDVAGWLAAVCARF